MYEFAGRFNRKDLIVKEFNYWILLLRPVPVTIGSCIILLKRKCSSLAQLTPEEMTEFPKVCKLFEESCKSLYGAIKFNYHANMMKEDFVHFHAIPRYDKEINKYGLKWIDKEWPTGVGMYKTEVSEEILQDIKTDFIMKGKIYGTN